MHQGLPFVLLAVSALDSCWLQWLLAYLLCMLYCKYASMRHQNKCNAWGAKGGMLNDQVQVNHITPYKAFTNLPLAFYYFSNLIMT
jgi:hypothetical protein